ncbi:MAG: hypothetical protein HYW48_10250 [Deltaproteobacteria bacterium]|nr:hypothetical protein [Deltaproteobacteria bacterium]
MSRCMILFSLMIAWSGMVRAEVELGDNWIRYTFRPAFPEDVEQLAGEPSQEGWSYPLRHYIFPGCLFRTHPVTIVGKAVLRIDLFFSASQWLAIRTVADLAKNEIFGVLIRWKEGGEERSEVVSVPSSALAEGILFSRTKDESQVIFLHSPSKLQPFSIKEFTFPDGADDLGISVCYVIDNTALTIFRVVATFLQGRDQ